jgi:lipoyl(octanoyl) transferase
MDLTPYHYINPCGYQGLRVTQLRDFGISAAQTEIEQQLAANLLRLLNEHWLSAAKAQAETNESQTHDHT